MSLSRVIQGLLVIAMIPVGILHAQEYPNKPIRIMTGSSGAALDIVSRLIAPGLSASLGQPVIVENTAGIIAIETVAKAPPDGYMLLFFGSPIWLGPFLQGAESYDPMKDFSPITLAVTQPIVMVVSPSLRVNSVKELIALAKSQPGKLNYATATLGSPGHLATVLFKARAGINIVEIPYKGSVQAHTAVMTNEAQLMIDSAGGMMTLIKSGKLKPLAVTSSQPSVLFPGLPTVAASGLPGYDAEGSFGFFAPAKTPSTEIERLNQEIARALTQADVKEKLLNSGMVVVGSTPAQFEDAIRSEVAVMGKLIKDLGIHGG